MNRDNYKSEPFNGLVAPTISGMPNPVIIQMEERVAQGEESSPGRQAAPVPTGTDTVANLLVDWADKQLEHSKKQCEDVHRRAQATRAAKMRSSRMVTQSSNKGDLGSKIYDSEAADQVDDATGLHKELIFQDERLVRVDFGPSERYERAAVVQMALDAELKAGNIEDETEAALHRYILYPFSGYKAVRNFRRGKACYYQQAVNPLVMAFSDVGRPCQQQYSIHEAHFFTKREMVRAGFKNTDKLGSADGMGRNSIYPYSDPNSAKSQGTGPNETYEVYETWGEPPWADWIESNKCTLQQVQQFAAENGFKPNDINPDSPDQHCVFHKDKQLLKYYPNYLLDKTEMPYYITSHYPAENGLFGEAQMERVADAHNAIHILLNDWMDNMRMIGNQAMFYKTSASVSPEMLDRAMKPRGRVPVAGSDSFEDMFMFFKPENIGSDLMAGINFFNARVKAGGVDDVLRGQAKPRTATQSQNDNARSQATINNAGSRFVRRALRPAARAVMQMIIGNYSQQDWYAVAGEDGAQMIVEPWMVDPDIIDKHFWVVPVATFDFQSQGQKIQEIVNLITSFGPALQMEQVQAAFEESVKLTSLKKHQQDRIINSIGTATDALEEVQAMIDNPWTEPEVIPADDHRAAMLVAQSAVAANPNLYNQTNFRKWTLKHQLYLFQQMQQQQAEQQQAAIQNRGKQIPKQGGPTDEQGQARQQAQMMSPPDEPENPGMTGMGAMPALG